MIEKRISTNFCNEIEFARSLPIYKQALRRADTRLSLLLTQIRSTQNLAATENATLFGSTSHSTIKFPPTSVKLFSTFYVNLFPPNHRLYKICNKNNIKLSYSCTPNMGNIVAAQYKELINQHNSPPKAQPCNSRNTESGPLLGYCREKNIIYQATVRSTNNTMNYFGLCETDLKTRYYNHTHSFRNRS